MSYYQNNFLTQGDITGAVASSVTAKDNEMLDKMSQHLMKFNQQENVVGKSENIKGTSTR